MLILETHRTFDFLGGSADPISPLVPHIDRLRGSGWEGGGSAGIHYSLKFSPLFISLKFWVIH